MAAAVGAAHRLPCAAHPGVARRNSLRSLRELRSDNRRESEARSALRAPTPRLRCSAPQTSPRAAPCLAAAGAPPGLGPGPLRPAAQAASMVIEPKTATLAANTATLPATARAARRRRACAQPRSAAVPAGARSALRLLTRRDCPSAARAASVASFAARPALRASQGTPAQRGPAPARRRRAARTVARAVARANVKHVGTQRPTEQAA